MQRGKLSRTSVAGCLQTDDSRGMGGEGVIKCWAGDCLGGVGEFDDGVGGVGVGVVGGLVVGDVVVAEGGGAVEGDDGGLLGGREAFDD